MLHKNSLKNCAIIFSTEIVKTLKQTLSTILIFFRRSFLPLSVISFVLVSCSLPKNENPNIIIIYADDLGYGDISCQNSESKIETPNIDKLTNDGMFPEGFGITTAGQLYNLKDDPQEQHNLYKDFPEIVNELTLMLDDIIKNGRSR